MSGSTRQRPRELHAPDDEAAREPGGEVGYRYRVQCPECQSESPTEARFCGQCGAPVRRACPSCGTEAAPGAKFCSECGSSLTGPPEGPREPPEPSNPPLPRSQARSRSEPWAGSGESEIKQATVLCCEVVLDAPEALDAELQHDLLSQFRELAQSELDRFGGSIDQVLSRGFLALFGAPVAQEDHPVRAALTASALRRTIEEHAPRVLRGRGVRWSTRMAIDTGEVVIGGAGNAAVGEATDRARHLLEAASAGAILVSDPVADQVRARFQLIPGAEGEDQRASGASVWRLEAPTPAPATPRRRGDARLSPFVGRQREMTLLEELRRQADAGQGQVVGIAGEPGSGKSRLLHELAASLEDLPVSYLRGQCLSYAVGIPYSPFVDMIRRASDVSESDDPATVAAKLNRSVASMGLDPDDHLPYFLRLLGLRQGPEGMAGLEPQALQSQTFEAMRRMVIRASRRSLVVMEIEDLHWIDDTSEAFLATLIEAMAGARVLLLLTYRSGYSPGWLHKTFATQITMRRLSPDDSRMLAASILGDDEGARSERIVEKAQGNPFFLEELARTLMRDAEDEDEDEPSIPGTVQGVLMARIDRLPDAHKRLLQVASVFDREVSLPLLREVWDRPDPLPELLADLQRWELLYTSASGEPATYSFRHALTRDVAYQGLLRSRRRLLHGRIAEVLERLYADRLEDVYDRLIHHFPRAGDSRKTVHYLTLFAERAAQDYAHAEAARALRGAIVHAGRLPDDIRDRRRVELVLRLAESLLPLARFAETLKLCQAHEDALHRLGDRSLEAHFRFWLAHTYTYLGHQNESLRQAELSLEAAREIGNEAVEGKGCYVLGRYAFWAGDYTQGLERSQRAVVLLERTGEPWWQGQAYWVSGFHHWALGQFEPSLRAFARASEIGEAVDDYRLDASWSIGFVHASLGDGEAGIEHCQRAIERSQDPLNTAVATGFLGYAHFQKGEVERALLYLREAVQRLDETGMRQLFGWVMAFLGKALLLAGRFTDGREAASEALQVSREAEFAYGVALARRILGRIDLAAGERERGLESLDQALADFRALGAPFEVARTCLALAYAGGRREGARDPAEDLTEAQRIFVELGAERYVRESEAIAPDLGLETLPDLSS